MKKIKELVSSAKSGNKKSFDKLYELTHNDVWYNCLSLLKDEENAKDIMQETYITAFLKLDTLKDEEKFCGWVTTIAVNLCKKKLKGKVEYQIDDEVLITEAETDELMLPEEYITKTEKRKVLLQIMEDTLSFNQYQTVLMFYFDEMSISEIAQGFEISEGTVKSRLNSSRAKMKTAIEDYEKKSGDKLHGVVVVPFFTTIFKEEAKSLAVPNITIKLPNGQTLATSATKGIATGAKSTVSSIVKATANATVKAKVWYQKKGAKKKKKVTLKCKLSVTKYVSPEAKKKANVLNATTKYQPLAKLAAQHGFKLGTVVNYTNVTTNDNYKNLVKYHFNSLTAGNEFKAYSLLDRAKSAKSKDGMPVMNYDKADTIISFAKENGIQMRGHVLVWHAYMCDWFFREGYDTGKKYVSKAVMQKRLQYYIKEVITHFEKKYPGVIYCWDVVNEAVADQNVGGDNRNLRKDNQFYKILGSDYVEQSFLYAKNTVDELGADIKLYYNDYNSFYKSKREEIVNLVKSINSYAKDAKGNVRRLCDGVGMQGYIGGYGTQNGCMNDQNISDIKKSIETYAALGCEVQVTEMAVRNYMNTKAIQKKHAEFYKKLFQMFVDVNAIPADCSGKSAEEIKKLEESRPLKAVSIWGWQDDPSLEDNNYSYSMNGPYCGLFTELYAVKDSFKNVYEVLADKRI